VGKSRKTVNYEKPIELLLVEFRYPCNTESGGDIVDRVGVGHD
jgi:hypothetical protein